MAYSASASSGDNCDARLVFTQRGFRAKSRSQTRPGHADQLRRLSLDKALAVGHAPSKDGLPQPLARELPPRRSSQRCLARRCPARPANLGRRRVFTPSHGDDPRNK
jgi:hypothetical protein